MSPSLPPVKRIRWSHAWRIVPSRFPPVGVYDRIADPADIDALFAVEALTNPRLREEADALKLVPKEHRISGPGSTPVMAAFQPDVVAPCVQAQHLVYRWDGTRIAQVLAVNEIKRANA